MDLLGEWLVSRVLRPWENGSLVGFYGLAGYYIDGIGVYLRQILKIGTWGKTLPAGPQNNWSFKLEPTYHLTKITIDHGDLIYSLMFTAQYGDLTYTSEKMGGWNGGENVTEVKSCRLKHMAGPGGGRGGPPARARYFERHIFYKRNRICICKIFFFLIGYTHTNTNIGPFTKLFLWFRLCINPFAIRFRPLVNTIPNLVRPKGQSRSYVFGDPKRTTK
ncbi:putative jacalin-like lectin domain-containing protein [Helianthus annuus]|nr:putative jacalin-like lectin domain-containing protein [Helianthus annuus]